MPSQLPVPIVGDEILAGMNSIVGRKDKYADAHQTLYLPLRKGGPFFVGLSTKLPVWQADMYRLAGYAR